MAHRFALILVLLTAVPASAQDWEIVAGAGLWLLNPARVADFDVRSTSSVNVAWTHWYDEQSSWTVGVHAMPRYGDGERMLFGHVTQGVEGAQRSLASHNVRTLGRLVPAHLRNLSPGSVSSRPGSSPSPPSPGCAFEAVLR